MEIPFCSHPSCSKVIAMKYCTRLCKILLRYDTLQCIYTKNQFSIEFELRWKTRTWNRSTLDVRQIHPEGIHSTVCYNTCILHLDRDHFVYAPSQWETTLQCNVVSHWLGAFTKWALLLDYNGYFSITGMVCVVMLLIVNHFLHLCVYFWKQE